MKIASRLILLMALLTVLTGVAVRPAQAQNPDPKFDALFVKARELETDQPAKSLDEYAKVKNDQKDREAQGDALLRSGLLGYNKMVSLEKELANLTSDAKNEKEGAILGVGRRGYDSVKMLMQQYSGTAAEKSASVPAFDGKPLKEAMEMEIDRRNANTSVWYNKLSYKVVDNFVALTGRTPALSYWLALLLIALLVKGLTFPLTLSMYRSQREMQKMQPIMKDLQERHADDKVRLNEEVMKAYKEHGVNPFASCLPMFIQLPFLWWVYHTIQLYEFHFTNGHFLWIGSALSHQYPNFLAVNMGHFDIPLLVLYAGSNYVTMRMTPSTDPQAAQTQKTMALMMTGMMFYMFMTYRWSGAFIFYWLVLNIISTAQTYFFVYKPAREAKMGGGGSTGGGSGAILPPLTGGDGPKNGSNGSGKNSIASSRPVTPVPGGEGMRARPRRKKR